MTKAKPKLKMPRGILPITFGLVGREEEKFQDLGLIGSKKSHTLCLVGEYRDGDINYSNGLYWIVKPKTVKRLSKVKETLLHCLEKAATHGIMGDLVARYNAGLVSEALTEQDTIDRLVDQLLPIYTSLYGVGSAHLKDSRIKEIRGLANERIGLLGESLLSKEQVKHAKQIASYALKSNPDAINSNKLFHKCVENSAKTGGYLTFNNLKTMVYDEDKGNGYPRRHADEVRVVVSGMVRREELIPVCRARFRRKYKSSSVGYNAVEEAYRLNLRKGLERRTEDRRSGESRREPVRA